MVSTVEDIDHDLEARKHLWKGLGRMEERDRVKFLQLACRQVQGPDKLAEVRVTESSGHQHEVYMDLMLLAVGHGLHLGRTCELMERCLKRYQRRE